MSDVAGRHEQSLAGQRTKLERFQIVPKREHVVGEFLG